MNELRNALRSAAPDAAGHRLPEAAAPMPQDEMRLLGVLENLFAAYSEQAITTFTMMAEIEGRIGRIQIERALKAVQLRHPLLGVGIRRGASGFRTFVRGARPIPLHELPSVAVPWELAAGLELRRRFDVEQGPLLQVAMRPESRSMRMFFTFHHSIADGVAAVYVIRDFVRALGGARLTVFAEAASLDERLADLPTAQAVAPEETGSAPPAEPDATAARRWGRGMARMPIVSARVFAPALTRRIRDVARFHDTTVHAALSVALARAMAETRLVSAPIRVMSPINQRGALGIEDDCGLFISGGSTLPDATGTSFWDAARKARAALEPSRKGDAVQGMVAAMAAFRSLDDSAAGACGAFAAGFEFDAMLTNLGALPIVADEGRHRVKAIAGPIVLASVEDEHVIGAATLEDRLHLTYTSITPLPALLERMEKRLAEACASW